MPAPNPPRPPSRPGDRRLGGFWVGLLTRLAERAGLVAAPEPVLLSPSMLWQVVRDAPPDSGGDGGAGQDVSGAGGPLPAHGHDPAEAAAAVVLADLLGGEVAEQDVENCHDLQYSRGLIVRLPGGLYLDLCDSTDWRRPRGAPPAAAGTIRDQLLADSATRHTRLLLLARLRSSPALQLPVTVRTPAGVVPGIAGTPLPHSDVPDLRVCR